MATPVPKGRNGCAELRAGETKLEKGRKWRLPRKAPFPLCDQRDAFFSGKPEKHERDRNRPPDCKTETAAPSAKGNGGNQIENLPKIFKDSFYTRMTVEAIARYHPRLAFADHYVVEPSGKRWRIIVRRMGLETIEFFETPGLANQARQTFADAGLVGFTVGVLS